MYPSLNYFFINYCIVSLLSNIFKLNRLQNLTLILIHAELVTNIIQRRIQNPVKHLR